MASQSFTPSAMKAYLAGRELAKTMSIDPASAEVPAQFAGYEVAFREGIDDEQSGTPVASVSSATITSEAPKSGASRPFAGATAKVSGTRTTRAPNAQAVRLAEKRKFFQALNTLPIETVRQVAVDQIENFDKAIAAAPYFTKTFQGNYAALYDDIARARSALADGDQLNDKPDAASQLARRNWYRSAYDVAWSATENAAENVGDEDFLIMGIGKIVVPAVVAAQQQLQAAAEDAAKAGKDLVQGVGSTAKTVAIVVGVGGALALIVFASQRGKRR